MRVIGGSFRGKRLRSAKGHRIRPTSSRAREALFDILGPCQGLKVLDLFAGSGALGLEALSRGADFVVFVDRSFSAIRMIRHNIQQCGVEQRSRVIHGDALKALRKLAAEGERFSLILMDPPYEKGLTERALALVAEEGLLRPGSLAAAEHSASEAMELAINGLDRIDQRRYGDTAITFWRCSVALNAEEKNNGPA